MLFSDKLSCGPPAFSMHDSSVAVAANAQQFPPVDCVLIDVTYPSSARL